MTHKAFEEHILHGMRFSKTDIDTLAASGGSVTEAIDLTERIIMSLQRDNAHKKNYKVPGTYLERLAKFNFIMSRAHELAEVEQEVIREAIAKGLIPLKDVPQ